MYVPGVIATLDVMNVTTGRFKDWKQRFAVTRITSAFTFL